MDVMEADQEFVWNDEVKPFIGKLQVYIGEARGTIPCVDPYILCIYDFSEAIRHCETVEKIVLKPHDGDCEGLQDLDIRSCSERGKHLENPKWNVSLSFNVRELSLPLEIYLFDRGNPELFLGRVRFVPSPGSDLSRRTWTPLGPREDLELEKATGSLEVSTCFVMGRKDLVAKDFKLLDIQDEMYPSRQWVQNQENRLIFHTETLDIADDRFRFRKQAKAGGFIRPAKLIFSSPQRPLLQTVAVDEYYGEDTPLWYIRQGHLDDVTTRFYIAETILVLEDLLEYDSKRLYITEENLALDGLGHITFCDFHKSPVKISRNVTDDAAFPYMAPEVLQGLDCSWVSNLWSLGVIVYELRFGFHPFKTDSSTQTIKNICSGKIRFPKAQRTAFMQPDFGDLRRSADYGSPTSYETALSRFGSLSKSIYATPSSFSDIWARGSGPSDENFLKQLFATKEQKASGLKYSLPDLVHNRGLLLPAMEELDWSGQGQHVEFGIAQPVPLEALAALGHGALALVDSVMCRRIKLARKTMVCTRKQKLETMINEVEHLQHLRHPHIIQLVGTYLQGKKFAILLYPVAEWNLASFLEICQGDADSTVRGPESQALDGFYQCLAHALAHVHNKTIKHMDFKPQNVLVRLDWKDAGRFRVYLADFGISKKFAASDFSQTDGGMAGTRKYCAPEVYAEESRGRSADIFSLGCVFLEMLTVVHGFQLDHFAESRSHVTDPREEERDYSFHGNLERVSLWIDKISVAWAKEQSQQSTTAWRQGVVRRMLLKNPSDRPTAPAVLDELGGARDCCVQEREVFEAEEDKLNPPALGRTGYRTGW